MAWILMIIACVFFFLAAVGATLIPNPTSWGLFFMALGFVAEMVGPWVTARAKT